MDDLITAIAELRDSALAVVGDALRQRRPRRPTLASVAKQASKAGIAVARYEVEPGKIVVVPGKPSPAKRSSWDDLEETGTRQ